MIKVGITGTIGSGKTIVCKVFETLNVAVYFADQEAKKLYLNAEVKNTIKEEFGESVFDTSGEIDLKKVAHLIFGDQEALIKINSIIHPRVKQDFNDWVKDQKQADYILYESALLFESGFYKDYQILVNVSAPRPLCISRVMLRDSISKEQVTARMDRQFSDEKKSELADYIIINDDLHLIIPQVLALHEEFTSKLTG